ncbi:MAG: hypothetical protein IKQ99_03195 [Alphaproteobacteria bacterium]|nr:hypothetical protein [Alphaproteobacteria bacterium]
MKKNTFNIKKHKKVYLLGTIGLIVIAFGVSTLWNTFQFSHYCKDKELCACSKKKLTSNERKAFVAIAKYMKQTGKPTIDEGILKYASEDDLAEVSLKMKSCSADLARKKMLDNVSANRKNFPGDYNCMRQTLTHELSNNEILFLQSPEIKTIEALRNPVVRNMYLISSSKMMKCMNKQVQQQYQEEVKKIRELEQPPKKAEVKKEEPSNTPKAEPAKTKKNEPSKKKK